MAVNERALQQRRFGAGRRRLSLAIVRQAAGAAGPLGVTLGQWSANPVTPDPVCLRVTPEVQEGGRRGKSTGER